MRNLENGMFEQVASEAFRPYGRVLTGYDFTDIIQRMEQTLLPDDVIYVMKDEKLEESGLYKQMQGRMFGESEIQFGYCNGHNKSLNALEYHRCSEVNIAATDMVLLLGLLTDVTDDFRYDTSKVKAFLVPKGTAVEIYATTLHYAPCNVDDSGFRCVVVLPEGTNAQLEETHDLPSDMPVSEDALLAARNKWLIAHEDAGIPGAWNGLVGKNITI